MFAIENYDFNNKKAIIRVDFNVPLNANFEITDDTRIRAAIPTIKRILDANGAVILMSHLGRPKGAEEKFSLKHILKHLSDKIGVEVKFANDCISEEAIEMKKNLKSGEVLLLENLRFYSEEKKGDVEFAKKLAEGADVYVNDAFGTAHRAHASTAIIADFFPNNKMFGFVIENELNSVDNFLNNSEKPVTAIVGGAKVSSKIEVLENLIDKVDNIIIAGGMAYTFVKAHGGKIGTSLCEEDMFDTAKKIEAKAAEKGVKLYFPVDAHCGDAFSNDANEHLCKVDEIPDGWMGLDITDDSINLFKKVLSDSKAVLWNGPFGVFEFPKFERGTKEIAEHLGEITAKGTFTIVGGGDSVAAVNKYGVADKVSYVSTGGGALLEYIEGKELPGVKAIRG
jgi:phosphoglycerate kinase